MYLKEHMIRVKNIKIMQTLHAAGIDHKVIAMFMSCEGFSMQSSDICAILNRYATLGSKKLPTKKVQALIDAKHLGEQDESLPCPASY